MDFLVDYVEPGHKILKAKRDAPILTGHQFLGFCEQGVCPETRIDLHLVDSSHLPQSLAMKADLPSLNLLISSPAVLAFTLDHP